MVAGKSGSIRKELDAVPPRVLAIEAALTGEGRVPGDANARAREPGCNQVEVSGRKSKRGVGLARSREFRLDADVKLLIADGEPNAASLSQRLGLLDLVQSNEVAEEAPGIRLATGRCGNLNVSEANSHEEGDRSPVTPARPIGRAASRQIWISRATRESRS